MVDTAPSRPRNAKPVTAAAPGPGDQPDGPAKPERKRRPYKGTLTANLCGRGLTGIGAERDQRSLCALVIVCGLGGSAIGTHSQLEERKGLVGGLIASAMDQLPNGRMSPASGHRLRRTRCSAHEPPRCECATHKEHGPHQQKDCGAHEVKPTPVHCLL